MIRASNNEQESGFSRWLRTGRLPPVRSPDGLELKFNPWHDPRDGRFTFAGSGQNFGRGQARPADGAGSRVSTRAQPATPAKRRIATRADAETWRAEQLAKYGNKPENRAAIEARFQQYITALASRPNTRPNPAAEFVSGVGQGLYAVADGTAKAVYSAVTTNPITTVRDIERGVAGMIDGAIAAEDIPARVQLSLAADAAANASARDVGRAVGSVVGNVAVTVAPGAAAAKFSALRRLRLARPSAGPFPPPKVGWVKENLGPDSFAKRYNDAATGARPGQAPTLRRTMPDGSTRPVKFDGIEGDTLIDRKWSIRDMVRSRAQTLRQSEALAQNHLIGLWEVPNEAEKVAALKMIKKLRVTNIIVRVVKP